MSVFFPFTSLLRKSAMASLFAVAFFLFSVSSVLAGAIQARSVMLINLDTMEVLYEQDPDFGVPPASLTKVLSMYVVFDALKSGRVALTDQVVISANAAATTGSRMGLKKGETVGLEKLIMGMAVSSGNDASAAVAEHVAGSEEAFMRLMNAKAQRLGMKNSLFLTVHGLPAQGQITTGRDMLELTRNYLTMYPEVLRYHSTRQIIHNRRATTNKNPLLGKYEGADGLKTGWTNASGYNIITTAQQGDTRLVAVLLGAKNSQIRAKEINRLMSAGFAVCSGQAKNMELALGLTPKAVTASR